MTMKRVVVTGLGILSPLGRNVKDSWIKLISGGCGIEKLNQPEYKNLPCRVAATLSDENDMFNLCDYFSKSDLRSMAPATAYGLIATKEAVQDSCWIPNDDLSRERTGVAVGMGMVDLVDICQTNADLNKSYNRVSPYFVPRILPNMAAGNISIKYGLWGPNHSVSTACATGVHAIGDAYRFIKHGDAEVMICGAAEACISPLSIAAFCRLRALCDSFNDDPKVASRPFDKQRCGFVMGEGAAIIILEELQHALNREAKIYAEILGYGLSGDASHLTAPSKDGFGAFLAMKRAITDAQLRSSDIGYINAHATSTPLGDAIEVRAIKTLFENDTKQLAVSSTKGAHGHLLGSAGSLEAAFTILSCKEGILPPTINLKEADSDLNFVPNEKQVWTAQDRRIALKNSFGFGGTNASLCIGEFQS